jgi:hypothetical protein
VSWGLTGVEGRGGVVVELLEYARLVKGGVEEGVQHVVLRLDVHAILRLDDGLVELVAGVPLVVVVVLRVDEVVRIIQILQAGQITVVGELCAPHSKGGGGISGNTRAAS